MSDPYDRAWVSRFYDAYGEREWTRLGATPTGELQFEVQAAFLREYLEPGMAILEIGPGPGRFTELFAEMGLRVTIGDVSPGQLELHRRYAAARGFEHAVESRHEIDVVDLSTFPDASFDAVVVIGGPISYVFDRAGEALRECRRVVRPGGLVFVGVMSLWGTIHEYLSSVAATPIEINTRIVRSGDLLPEDGEYNTHFCHLYRSEELLALMASCDFDLLAARSTGCLWIARHEQLAAVRTDPDRWAEMVRLDVEASRAPGMLDAGTHIIAVGRRSDQSSDA